MDDKYYLMLKQHKETGLKYLCFHKGSRESCFTYKGSGLYWLRHLKKHGKNISTIILKESYNKEEISKEGIMYSAMWNVVESKEFANLIIENAESDPSKLQTKESRVKRVKSMVDRIARDGLSDAEKIAKKHAINIMHSPENREKAKIAILKRFETGDLTDKQKMRGINHSNRIKKYGYSEKELNAHKQIREKQLGLSMKERLNNPEWIHPHKGKNFMEIHGENYTHPKTGKSMKYFRGELYIDPKAKPFKLIINDLDTKIFESEKDFITKTNLSSPILCKIKKNGSIIIKRQSNSRHEFKTGDTFKYFPITLEEYKASVIDTVN